MMGDMAYFAEERAAKGQRVIDQAIRRANLQTWISIAVTLSNLGLIGISASQGLWPLAIMFGIGAVFGTLAARLAAERRTTLRSIKHLRQRWRTPMTPEQIEEMKADITKGTQGPWGAALERGCHGVIASSLPEGGANFVALVGNDAETEEREPARFANARRIARLPDLEAEALRLIGENALLREGTTAAYMAGTSEGKTDEWALKPCPFCGGEANVSRSPYDLDYSVGCTECDMAGQSGFSSEMKALQYWNTRAEQCVEVKPLEWVDEDNGMLTAKAHGYEYEVGRENGYFYWQELSTDDFGDDFRTALDAAKAAQADYERRLLSAVKARSVAEVRAEAFEEVQ